MLKRHSLIALFLILSLLLSACGSAAAPAGNLTETAEEVPAESSYERLPDEAYEAVDYTLFPAPEGGYVGDVMPFVTDDGTLELYYLYDTDNNGQGYHPIWKYSKILHEGPLRIRRSRHGAGLRPDVRSRPRARHRLGHAGS